MLAHAVARLKVQPHRAWLRSLMASVRLRLDAATPTQLVGLAWALMVLRARPGTQWLLQLFGAIATVSERLGPKELRQVRACSMCICVCCVNVRTCCVCVCHLAACLLCSRTFSRAHLPRASGTLPCREVSVHTLCVPVVAHACG